MGEPGARDRQRQRDPFVAPYRGAPRRGRPVERRELRPDELWRTLASARLVVLRTGNHLCAPDGSDARAAEYEKIPDVIVTVLADDGLREEIRVANARDFDEHAAPSLVAGYVLETVKGHV
jgi:hypothetical protein